MDGEEVPDSPREKVKIEKLESGDMEQAVTFWRRAVERGGGTALLEEKLKQKKYIEKK